MNKDKQTSNLKAEEFDIERVCKAFIRLLDAPLVKEQEIQISGKRGGNNEKNIDKS